MSVLDFVGEENKRLKAEVKKLKSIIRELEYENRRLNQEILEENEYQ